MTIKLEDVVTEYSMKMNKIKVMKIEGNERKYERRIINCSDN